MFVSELLPHSTYLKEDILERKHVILNEKDMICIPFGTKDIPLGVEDVPAIANLDCLSVILSCVTLISSMVYFSKRYFAKLLRVYIFVEKNKKLRRILVFHSKLVM